MKQLGLRGVSTFCLNTYASIAASRRLYNSCRRRRRRKAGTIRWVWGSRTVWFGKSYAIAQFTPSVKMSKSSVMVFKVKQNASCRRKLPVHYRGLGPNGTLKDVHKDSTLSAKWIVAGLPAVVTEMSLHYPFLPFIARTVSIRMTHLSSPKFLHI
jgi:hypothetical protein